MKTLFFSALALSAATLTFAPVANAAEVLSSNSIQQRRLEFLDTQTKAVENIQEARLEFLENQTKAVEDIQATRLEFLGNQTKDIDNIQKVRLEHLDTQTKAIENIQEARLEFLENQTKAIEISMRHAWKKEPIVTRAAFAKHSFPHAVGLILTDG